MGSVDHTQMAAIFLCHHTQGRKLKCATALFSSASYVNVGSLTNVYNFTVSWLINNCKDNR